MKKQKPVNLLKKALLAFGIILFFWNCQKEDENLPISDITNKENSIEITSLNDILNNNTISKVAFGLKSKNYQSLSKNATNEPTFKLKSSKGIKYTGNGKTYHVFLMERIDATDAYYYNLVVSESNGVLEKYIYKYPLDKSENIIISKIGNTNLNFNKNSGSEKTTNNCVTTPYYLVYPCPCVGHINPYICTCYQPPVFVLSHTVTTCTYPNPVNPPIVEPDSDLDPDITRGTRINGLDAAGCYSNGECLPFEPNPDAFEPYTPIPSLTPEDFNLDDENSILIDELNLNNLQKDWLKKIENTNFKSQIENYLLGFVSTNQFDDAKIFAQQAIIAWMLNRYSVVNFKEFETTNYINNLVNPITEDPIEFYLLAKYKNSALLDLSIYSIASNQIQIGEYYLTPSYGINNKLVFYVAFRHNHIGIEYIIRADSLDDFRNKISLYTAAANLFYLNGIPSNGQIAMAAGDYFTGLKDMWADALSDPNYYIYLAHIFVGTATNLNAVNSPSKTFTNNKINYSNITNPNSSPNYVINNRSFNQYKDLIQQKYNIPWQSTSSPNVQTLTKRNIVYRARTVATEWQYGYTIDYVKNGVTIGKIRFYN